MAAPELELTKESHELARAWVSANWNRKAKAVRYAAPTTRPARLGLGAKYVPHKPEADRAQSSAGRIDAKLRKDLGLSAADCGRDSPRRAVDGRVHRAQPGWTKGVDKVQDGNPSSSGDSDKSDDEIDSRTLSLGRAAVRGKRPERGPSIQIKRQREPQEAPITSARQKKKRGPVVRAASVLPSDTLNGAPLTAQQRKKQRRRERKAAAAAAAAAAASATTDVHSTAVVAGEKSKQSVGCEYASTPSLAGCDAERIIYQ